MNKVILMGRLSRDPEIRYTQTNNVAQCSFSIAVDRPGKQPDGTTKADFINCVAWRQTAEFINKYFSKGNRILIIGSIQVRDYTDKDGRKVYVTEVIVDNAEFCESKASSAGSSSYGSATPAPDFGGTQDSGSGDAGFFPLDKDEFVPF
ncbi:MAG: single-stranded DNA-binding protein [Clostridia bacterium]|nr:single-stranded DNA-binding protein [Clostridia bacterium]MCR5055620.1 single-stranded DNA-binding protein [Clostridia bacterium]